MFAVERSGNVGEKKRRRATDSWNGEGIGGTVRMSAGATLVMSTIASLAVTNMQSAETRTSMLSPTSRPSGDEGVGKHFRKQI